VRRTCLRRERDRQTQTGDEPLAPSANDYIIDPVYPLDSYL